MPTKKSVSKTTKKSTPRKALSKPKTEKLSSWGKIWRLALCIAVPLGGGFVISLLTRNAMETFGNFSQPPLAPPAWLFPVAWTILYILMGVASYLIFYYGAKNPSCRKTSLILYGLQLALNFGWTIVFFNLEQRWAAFAMLMVMWLLIIVIMLKSAKISKAATLCLLPYVLWVTFAAYLNLSIAILN